MKRHMIVLVKFYNI